MKFFVECIPKGKARPRVVRGHAYTPASTVECEKLVRAGLLAHCVRLSCAVPKVEGAAAVDVEVRLPIPKSWSKKRQEAARRGEVVPASRPDVDNYVKLVLDALNGIAWDDDSCVIRLAASKRYAPDGIPGFKIKYVELSSYE